MSYFGGGRGGSAKFSHCLNFWNFFYFDGTPNTVNVSHVNSFKNTHQTYFEDPVLFSAGGTNIEPNITDVKAVNPNRNFPFNTYDTSFVNSISTVNVFL